jgi:6-pyruvoyltetrahydropterin/6-carboxytetrahydropterin synthase
MNVTSLYLSKQDFKFSSAHFLIFSASAAEKLHGHNYRVRIKMTAPGIDELPKGASEGFVVDFGVVKKMVRARLELWDEHLLLPSENPHLKIGQSGNNYEVKYANRNYSFPVNEVILLPIPNVSVEHLSKLLAEEWFPQLVEYGVLSLTVSIEETLGQSGSYTVKN